MSNQELISAGNKTMDETDQAIERSKQVHSSFWRCFSISTIRILSLFPICRLSIKQLKWEHKLLLPWKAKWVSLQLFISFDLFVLEHPSNFL